MLLIQSRLFSSFYMTSVRGADIVRNKSCLRSIGFSVYSYGPTDSVRIRPAATTRPGFGKLTWLSSPSSSGLSSTFSVPSTSRSLLRENVLYNIFSSVVLLLIYLVHFPVKIWLGLLGKIFSPVVGQTVNPILADFNGRHRYRCLGNRNSGTSLPFHRLWKLLNRVRTTIRTQATESSREKQVSTANARCPRHGYNWNPPT